MGDTSIADQRRPSVWWIRLCRWLWGKRSFVWGTLLLGICLNVLATSLFFRWPWSTNQQIAQGGSFVWWMLQNPGTFMLYGIVLLLLTVIVGLVSRLDTRSVSPVDSRYRERLLKRVRTFWIQEVLEQSLYNEVRIELGLQQQPDAIENPWQFIIQEVNRPARPLPAGTGIKQVYDDANGELLILGEPGVGKTTLLLELARNLLDRADHDHNHPIPVVFNLSSWEEGKLPFATWLEKELFTKYQTPRKVGRAWIQADQLLILLDGLDEVAATDQTARITNCIEEINKYHQEHNLVSIVVCSRRIEYSTQTTQIVLNSAITIQPLAEKQVNDFLASAGKQLESLRLALDRDPALRELATTPLMLNVLALACQGKVVEDILKENIAEAKSSDPIRTEFSDFFETLFGRRSSQRRPVSALRQQVFTIYVQQMLHRRGSSKQYPPQQTIYWLSWLTKHTHILSQAVFLQPQAEWLPQGWPHRLYKGCKVSLILILLAIWLGLAAQSLRWLNLFSFGFLLLEGITLSGLALPIVRYVTSEGDPKVLESAKVSMRLVFLPFILMTGVVFLLPQRWLILLLSILLVLVTLIFVVASTFIFDLILYRVTRALLYWSGCIPWKHRSFLGYAAEHLLLRKTGDYYIFIHDLLYAYFAALDATPPKRGEKRRSDK